MRRYLEKLGGALSSALSALALVMLILGPASALVFPGQFAPRAFPTQQVHYERHLVTLTTTGMTVDGSQFCAWNASTPFVCAVRVGALPYNAYLLRAYMQVTVACTLSTACGLGMGTGTVASGNQLTIMATASILSTTGSVAQTVVAANAGIAATGNGITQTGANGGFDLYVTGTATVAVPGAGTAILVLEYLGANDGACTAVPLEATATAC